MTLTRRLSALLLGLLSVTLALGAWAQEPQLEWAYETKGKIYSSPILTDLDGDDVPEVIVCVSREGRVICLDGRGELRWDYLIEDSGTDGIQATPSALDTDGDGRPEIYFITTGGMAGCLDASGSLRWRTFTGDKTDYSGTLVTDIDADSGAEVVFGSDSGTIYCLDDCGIEKWHYQGDGQVRGIPATAWDEESGTWRVYAVFGGGVLACLTSEGEVVWSHDEPSTRKERRCGPAIGDLDGDGTLEIVAATDRFEVIVRDPFTGAEKWRWKGLSAIDQTSSFALADFDGSGRLDIVAGDGTGLGGPGHVYRLRDGKALWTADVGGGVVQGPSVGDVDGDGQLEVLACSRSKRLVCLSQDGALEWEYPSDAGSLTTPALGDIDGDGEVEVVFTSKDRFVRCLSVGGAHADGKLPWPMMGRDPQLSNNATGAPFSTQKATGSPGEDLRIEAFGPLRVGDNTITCAFMNNAPRPRHLEVVVRVEPPGLGVVTRTFSNRCDPFERKTITCDVAVYPPHSLSDTNTCHLSVRLVDVGTGVTLAAEKREALMKPWAVEEREWVGLATRGLKLLEKTRDVSARPRLAGALHRAILDDETLTDDEVRTVSMERVRERGLEFINDVFKGFAELPPLAPRAQVRERVALVAAKTDNLRRIVARLDAAANGEAGDFAVVPCSPLAKVFRDEPLPAECRLDSLSISLAKNEAEAVQMTVVPLGKDLTNLRATCSALKQADGDGEILADAVEIARVGYIPIGPPEYNWFVEKRGDYPDVLLPADPVDVPASQDAQPYFVTVKTRPDTPTGTYEGVVEVTADGCASVQVPLRVRVWDFALTDETHLKTSMWMSEGYISRFYKHDGGLPWDVRKRFYDLHLSHRVGPVKDFPLEGGDKLKDFEYLLANGQNNFFIPVPEHVEGEARETLAAKYQATRDLLVEKGWNDLAMYYTRDEVAVVARHLIPKVVEMNHWIHEVVPEWPRLQTSAPEQSLFDAVDVWCPTIDHFDPVVLEERMAQGDRLWFYTVWGRPGIMIEFPATDYRLMFWQCWKYGAEGFLYWGTTHWDLNMTTDQRWPEIPWIPYNRQPGHNGCGYLIYPGADGTPLASIRLALARDGIEDYEYLHLLRELLAKAGDGCPKDLAERARKELSITPDVLVDHKTYTEDPAAIMNARGRIAAIIEELQAMK
ncbi:MAG: DUF4091 domain-containing protein [bacterium]|nr:DUF4091 domain-containing protein [bacterium]